MIFKYISAFALACGMLSLQANAQSTARNGTVFGDWRLSCSAPAVNQTICNISQRLSVEETGEFLAEVSLQPVTIDDQEAVVLALSTPTNTLLPMRPGYTMSTSSETLPLEWRTCSTQACLASRVLQPAELSNLKAGRSMILGYQMAGSNSPSTFSVSLNGVTKGLAAIER